MYNVYVHYICTFKSINLSILHYLFICSTHVPLKLCCTVLYCAVGATEIAACVRAASVPRPKLPALIVSLVVTVIVIIHLAMPRYLLVPDKPSDRLVTPDSFTKMIPRYLIVDC